MLLKPYCIEVIAQSKPQIYPGGLHPGSAICTSPEYINVLIKNININIILLK